MSDRDGMYADDRVIRVFISSTFRDMHAERDHLVTVVFPELRERLEQLGLEFFDVDLRWGIPQTGVDGERANSWAYCRQWIERVEPLFICILGQRYGWVPPADEIRDPVDRAAYEGLSITEMEVRHAVLSGRQRRRSFFYFRETKVPREETPGDVYEVFVDADERFRLQTLKKVIREESGRPVRDYRCQWTGKGFSSLDAFGQIVLEDLWSGVLRDARFVSTDAWRSVVGHDPDRDPLYTDETRPIPREIWERIVEQARPTPEDPLDLEVAEMAAFATHRLRWFQGRGRELEEVRSFIDSSRTGSTTGLCVVRSVAGAGKSALLAKVAENLKTSPHLVLTHFVGATARSADVRLLLDRLVSELDRYGIPHPDEADAKHDIEDVKIRLASRLERYCGDRLVVVLIDGVNQLTDGHDLSWLPERLGESVRIVMSAIDDSAAPQTSPQARLMAALEQRVPTPAWVLLQALDEADVREIIDAYLREFCKELGQPEKDAIAKMEQARNPLYLLVMLHELRSLGGQDMHLRVREIIAALRARHPNTLSLFDWMLERTEVFGVEAVRRWFTYLSLGRVGMSSRELSDLLALALIPDGARTARRIERSVRPYLLRRGAQWDYFHGQLREAVSQRFGLTDPAADHADIARYLAARWRTGDRHAISELPHHQVRSKKWDTLQSTLCRLDFIEAKCAAGLARDLIDDYCGAQAAQGGDVAKALGQFFHFVRSHCHVFERHSPAVFQMAMNEDVDTLPGMVAREQWESGDERRPWFRATTGGGARPPPLLILTGLPSEAQACAVDGNSGIVAAAGIDGTVCIWEPLTGVRVATFRAHPHGMWDCAFSVEGARFATSGRDGTVRLWDTSQWRLESEMAVASMRASHGVRIRFLPDRSGLVVAMGTAVEQWEWGTPSKTTRLATHDGAVLAVALDPAGRWLGTGGQDCLVRLRDGELDREVAVLIGHRDEVRDCAFSPDGAFLASAGADGRLIIWDTSGRTRQASVTLASPLNACRYVADGRLVVGCDSGEVYCMSPSLNGRRLIGRLDGSVRALATTGDRVVAAAQEMVTVLQLGAPTRGAPTRGASPGHDGRVTCQAFSKDGWFVATGSAGGTIVVQDTRTGDVVFDHCAGKNEISVCDLSSDGGMVAFAAGRYGHIKQPSLMEVYEVLTGRLITAKRSDRLAMDIRKVRMLRFTPDGDLLIVGGWSNVVGWDFQDTGVDCVSWQQSCGPAAECLFSPAGNRAYVTRGVLYEGVTADEGGLSAIRWTDGAEIGRVQVDGFLVLRAILRESGGVALALRKGGILTYDEALRPEGVFWPHDGGLLDVDSSEDGRLLATCGVGDSSIRLWDLENLAPVSEVIPRHGPPRRVSFLSGDQLLATMSGEGVVSMCDANRGTVAAWFPSGYPSIFAASSTARMVVLGSSSGSVDLLEPMGLSVER